VIVERKLLPAPALRGHATTTPDSDRGRDDRRCREGEHGPPKHLHRGDSWNRTSGLILISVSAGVVTIDAPYLLLCQMECSHNSVKDVVTTPTKR
jgi:hypothetical protein